MVKEKKKASWNTTSASPEAIHSELRGPSVPTNDLPVFRDSVLSKSSWDCGDHKICWRCFSEAEYLCCAAVPPLSASWIPSPHQADHFPVYLPADNYSKWQLCKWECKVFSGMGLKKKKKLAFESYTTSSNISSWPWEMNWLERLKDSVEF